MRFGRKPECRTVAGGLTAVILALAVVLFEGGAERLHDVGQCHDAAPPPELKQSEL